MWLSCEPVRNGVRRSAVLKHPEPGSHAEPWRRARHGGTRLCRVEFSAMAELRVAGVRANVTVQPLGRPEAGSHWAV